MKKLVLFAAVIALVSSAPAAFACHVCDLSLGCYMADEGSNRCTEDPEFICFESGGSCGGGVQQPLATRYSVASVRVVAPNAKQFPAPQPHAPAIVADATTHLSSTLR